MCSSGPSGMSKEQVRFSREQYNDYMNYQKEQDAFYKPYITDALETQTEASRQNMERASMFDAAYRQIAAPTLDALYAEAQKDPYEEAAAAAGRAASSVQQQSDIQEAIARRRNMAYGVAPDEGGARGLSRGTQVATAAARAGAANTARNAAIDRNWAKKLDVYGAATGQAGLSSGAYGLAGQMSASALGGANSALSTRTGTFAQGQGYLGIGNQAIANAQASQSPSPLWGIAGMAIGGMTGGMGTALMAGMAASQKG